ncbi:MAG: 4Fe-4S binding protein [Gammaproteobacteria bacterium]|jgi:carbon-monoxide dehydrogenase iron sulfur subunit|nr:MAG: 4Fe-4S binding protein [Gammaproteobacteria bacterium]
MKTIFVNPERCVGCRQCEFACAVEHSASRDPAQAVFESPPPRSRIHVMPGRWYNTSFPNRCRHCNPAPCQQVCPTAAITRDAEHDLVMTDAGKCIACAMCAMVCPFDAVTFHEAANGGPARVVALKCDGCLERIAAGQPPACVEACKSGALVYGELNELIAEGRAREASVVLTSAVASQSASTRPPDHVLGWRAWGTTATELNEGVHHGRH